MNKQQKEVLQSQLNNEKQTIKELKQVYTQALKDCSKKISELSAMADLEPQNIQSIIYQKQYQEAIKAQLEGVLVQMDSSAYASISEYLANCYQDGYVGVMYDIAAQGIPFIIPIDTEDVQRAIHIDSKLSKGLYKRLSEDVNELKKAVRLEVSRGISSGSSWNQIASNLATNFKNTPFNKAYNNSIRIARTEGHRIQNQSALDAQKKAKSKGADVVKQWDSTLDGATRDTHRLLDGQIREVDEPFEVGGMKADAPGMFGNPAEDCNCRCCLLQRARWALDDKELETLKERAEYFGIDKTKDFDDFKEKYLKASEFYRKTDGSNRRKREDGNEIIDKPTYNKLTKSFIANGGIIISGEDAAKHLGENHGASYLPGFNTAFIRDDATISEVLEEMYHAKQDRTDMFGKLNDEVYLLREIDAQKYLISMTERYKIPSKEVELTKINLANYEKKLAELYKKRGDE